MFRVEYMYREQIKIIKTSYTKNQINVKNLLFSLDFHVVINQQIPFLVIIITQNSIFLYQHRISQGVLNYRVRFYSR